MFVLWCCYERTIINENFVLTAGHCGTPSGTGSSGKPVSYDLKTYHIFVVFGLLNWCRLTEERVFYEEMDTILKGHRDNIVSVKKIILHPEMSRNHGHVVNDIALIKVKIIQKCKCF